MGVSFTAKTSIDEKSEKIVDYCNQYSAQHKWGYEFMHFFIVQDELFGDFKLPMSESKFNNDVLFALKILKDAGNKFGCDWEIFIVESIGKITSGNPDSEIQKMISEINETEENYKLKTNIASWKPKKGKKPRASGKKKFQTRWSIEQENEIFGKMTAREMPEADKTGEDLLDFRGVTIKPSSKKIFLEKSDLSFSKLGSKLHLKNCKLNFVNADFTVFIQSMQSCIWVAGKIDLHLDIKNAQDFCFENNVFNYSTIQNIYLTARFSKRVYIENCEFDYCLIKNLQYLYFKNCSFKHTNFNNSNISKSIFENCDFQDASFDNTIYSQTEFRNCTGINKKKMVKYLHISFGEQIGTENDIIIA